MERVMGIEPTYPAWEAGVLPMNYTRVHAAGEDPAAYFNIMKLKIKSKERGLVYVLYGSYRIIKQMRIAQIVLHVLEGGGVVVSVAYTLVGNYGVVYVAANLGGAVELGVALLMLGTEGEENRHCAEVVKMMINRRNAERAEVGDDKDAWKGLTFSRNLGIMP